MSENPGAQPTDQLEKLHAMSTTAGLTNTGYVAVNLIAVAACILGLASALAFLGALLLIIPLVGVVFAVAALRQIADSNGTQTGRGLAWTGLALCLLCGLGVGGRQVMDHLQESRESQDIGGAINAFGDRLRAQDFTAAYALCDDDFKSQVKFDQFQSMFQNIVASVGAMESWEWNGVRPFLADAQGSRMAYTKAKVKFARTGAGDRFNVILRQVSGKWLVNSLPDIFQPKKQLNKSDFDDPSLR